MTYSLINQPVPLNDNFVQRKLEYTKIIKTLGYTSIKDLVETLKILNISATTLPFLANSDVQAFTLTLHDNEKNIAQVLGYDSTPSMLEIFDHLFELYYVNGSNTIQFPLKG